MNGINVFVDIPSISDSDYLNVKVEKVEYINSQELDSQANEIKN